MRRFTPEEMENEARAWEGNSGATGNGSPGFGWARNFNWQQVNDFPVDKLEGDAKEWRHWLEQEKEWAAEGGRPERYYEQMEEWWTTGADEHMIVVLGIDNKYHVWEGVHRQAIAKANNMKTVPALVGTPKPGIKPDAHEGDMIAATKIAYVSPPHGALDITIIRDANPRVTISLDLGIPNFTVFSMNLPLAEGQPQAMSQLIAEAVHVLLDEVASFMLAMDYDESVIVNIYATVLATFKTMSTESDPSKEQDAIGADPTVQIYEGTFDMPMDFINETQNRVVTAAVKIDRAPKVRHIELTYSPKQKTKPSDTARVIRQYRNRSLKQQPKPMFVIVYDQMGKATGTIPIGSGKNFKNELLKAMHKKGSVDFTAPVSFVNEQEMKASPLNGIPRAISVAGMTYQPEALAGNDMALYHGPQDWIVKFPDGRTSIFPGRPTFRKMRTLNFPVPRNRFKWTMIPEDSLQQDEKFDGQDVGDEPEPEPTLQTLTPQQTEVKEAATPEPTPAPEPKLIEERYLTAKKLSAELEQMQNGTTKEWRGVTIERMNDHWLVRVGLGGVTLGKTPMAAAKYAVRFANALASGAWGSTVAPPRQ